MSEFSKACLKNTFILLNISLIILGAAILTLIVLLAVEIRYLSLLHRNSLSISIVIVFSALVGFTALPCESTVVFFTYYMFVTILICLQLPIGVFYNIENGPFTHMIEHDFRETYLYYFEEYHSDERKRRQMDLIQRSMKCCGLENTSEWEKKNLTEGNYSPSCCNSDEWCDKPYFTTSCLKALKSVLKIYSPAIGTLFFFGGVTEIVCIWWTTMLCHKLGIRILPDID